MTHARWLGATLALALAASPAAVAQPAPTKARPNTPARRGKQPKVVPPEDLAQLSGADVEAAARAAERLGASALPEAHDALLDALALGLSPEVAVPAIAAVAQHPASPPATDVGALRRYAGHNNPSVRGAAIAALATYDDASARAAVVAGLHDPVGLVRDTAAAAAGRARITGAVEALLALLARGEDASARGLAQLADPDLARRVANQLGKVPDATLAIALGGILKRADFGPDATRVEIVRAIGKIPHPAALTALSEYLAASPKAPPRESRQEAAMIINARGGK